LGANNFLVKFDDEVIKDDIDKEQAMELLKEIHSGLCGSHIAMRALVGKAFRQGLYYPMAIKDTEQIVETCKACQYATKHQRNLEHFHSS
jgi:hypothetical protein